MTWIAHAASEIKSMAAYLDSSEIPWKRLVIGLLWVVYLFETYISIRQLRLYNKSTPPKALVPHVSLDTFSKSQAYGKDKARLAIASDAIAHAYNLASVYFDLYALAWVWSGHLLAMIGAPSNELTKSAMWVVVNTAMHEVVAVPLSLYRHFVIEERHGFNKLTMQTFIMDTIKEWAMGIVIGTPLISLAVWVIRWAGDFFVVYTVLLFTAIVLFGTVLYPLVIQPLFNKLTPLPEGALRDRVMALASTLHFPLKHLYVIDGSKRSSHSNAYFYGVIPGGSKHIGTFLSHLVIYDTLIEKSTPAEIEAVLAHELGHWAHSDPTKLLAVSQLNLVLMLSLFTLFIHNTSLFVAFGFSLHQFPAAVAVEPYLPVIVGLELFQLVLNPTDALLKFGINAIVRRMEYAADRYAFLCSHSFAAELARAPKTESQTEAERLIASQGTGNAQPNATVVDWVDRLSNVPSHRLPTEKIGEALPEEEEPYAELLGRALVKLHIQKYVLFSHSLSSMYHDPLYSAYHYSHPTLTERLVALDRLKSAKKTK